MTIRRRHLLADLARIGAVASLTGLGGCGADPATVVIQSLRQTMPGSLLRQFRQERDLSLRFSLVEERQQLFQDLQTTISPPSGSVWNPLSWFRSAPPAPILSLLGADWLVRARDQDLIQPFTEAEVEPIWGRLPQRWRWSARSLEGQIWGIPWRWGATAIAYNTRRVSEPIQDWSDLWRPDLKGHLTLPDHPREVIGLTQKRLGRLYDSRLQPRDPQLSQALGELHSQVLIYTSQGYLPMLRTEDAWVAVGWTEDLFQLQFNFPDIEVVIPPSGSAVWWDLWVKAHGAQPDHSELISAWLDRVLDPELTTRFVELSRIASVLPVSLDQLPQPLQTRPDLDPQIWERLEIWQPLTQDQARLYLQLWQQMRSGQLSPL